MLTRTSAGTPLFAGGRRFVCVQVLTGALLLSGCASSLQAAQAPTVTATTTVTATVTSTPARPTPTPTPMPTDAARQTAALSALWKKAAPQQRASYCEFYEAEPKQAVKELREGVGRSRFDVVVITVYFDAECRRPAAGATR